MTITVSKVLCLVAVVIFAVAGFGGTIGSLSELDEIAFGLAFGFASFLVP